VYIKEKECLMKLIDVLDKKGEMLPLKLSIKMYFSLFNAHLNRKNSFSLITSESSSITFFSFEIEKLIKEKRDS
jgi:hypothetical protein